MANSSETQLLIREMGVKVCVCDPSQSPAAPLSLGLGSSSRNISNSSGWGNSLPNSGACRFYPSLPTHTLRFFK